MPRARLRYLGPVAIARPTICSTGNLCARAEHVPLAYQLREGCAGRGGAKPAEVRRTEAKRSPQQPDPHAERGGRARTLEAPQPTPTAPSCGARPEAAGGPVERNLPLLSKEARSVENRVTRDAQSAPRWQTVPAYCLPRESLAPAKASNLN